METIQIQNLSVDDLKTIISELIKDGLKNQPKGNPPQNKELYGTRKEVAKALHISLPTLNVLTKSGILKGYRLQGRVLYKWAEVENSLEEIVSVRYRRAQ